MPIKSNAQRRFMYAVLQGKVNHVPKRVAKEFIESTPKSKFKTLKEYVAPKRNKK